MRQQGSEDVVRMQGFEEVGQKYLFVTTVFVVAVIAAKIIVQLIFD